jgi:exodeoxyribonuclease V alpha subunit
MNGRQGLGELRRQGVLRDLDLHFAELMGRLANDDGWPLALAAGLASRRTGEGHVCLHLAQEAGRRWPTPSGELRSPPADQWLAALRGAPVVGQPGDFAPLILDPAGRLYLYRYWDYEGQLAAEMLRRRQPAAPPIAEEPLRQGLARLFDSPPPATGADWQRIAAAVAVLQPLCILSGGPGTGKTTTVVRILALLLEQAQTLDPPRHLRIALAAPTGKAAVRLQESIRAARQRLPVTPEVRAAIPDQVSTLHRLLGGTPDSVYFRHGRDNPLPVEVLVLDEASMVDIALMTKLLWALPPDARLLLLGDKDQLASVEAGAVLGELCAGAEGFSEPFRQRLERLTGQPIPAPGEATSPLADCVVTLRHSYRFAGGGGIGRLAQAINQGDAEGCRRLLEAGDTPELTLAEGRREPASHAADHYADYLERLRAGAGPAELFEGFHAFRCLCALREGPSGVVGLNQAIEGELERRGLIDPSHRWYPGRPLMITRNDYNLRLFNGDIGLVLPDPAAAGRLVACFPRTEANPGSGAGDPWRRLLPSRLPPHESCYAMTVHKSQGSEFDRVLLVLPEHDAPLLTRELLYTAVTRARLGLLLHGDPAALEGMVRRPTRRSSGLNDALVRGDGEPYQS